MQQETSAHWICLYMCVMRQFSCCCCSAVCNTIFHTIIFLNMYQYYYHEKCLFSQLPSRRVEFAIADDTAESVFVCFDVLTKLHNLEAREVGQMLVSLNLVSYYINHIPFPNTFTISVIGWRRCESWGLSDASVYYRHGRKNIHFPCQVDYI